MIRPYAAVLALTVFAGSIAMGHAQQTAYPARNVTIVNPTLAGSTTDGLARALAVGLSSRLGQQFVVSNQAGGAGAIGTATVARAPQDGHTLLFGAVYVLSVLPVLRPAEVGYRSDSLVPVCQTVSNAMVLVVRPDSRFKSLADLVAAARAEPGKITYGHQGPGSIPNLATEEFLQTANLRINQVPYRGDPAVLTDVLGGQIDVGALVLGSVPGQNVRILGVFAEERHPTFPDAPTVKEQGFDVAPVSFGGLLATAGTPAEVLSKLEAACAGAARDEAYVAAAKRAAQPPSYFADRATFGQRLARDIDAKKRLIERMNAQR